MNALKPDPAVLLSVLKLGRGDIKTASSKQQTHDTSSNRRPLFAHKGQLYTHAVTHVPNISLTIQSGPTHYSVNDQTRQTKYYARLNFSEDTAVQRLFIYVCIVGSQRSVISHVRGLF